MRQRISPETAAEASLYTRVLVMLTHLAWWVATMRDANAGSRMDKGRSLAATPLYQDWLALVATLRTLPARDKQLVRWIGLEGLSHAEVAHRLAIPPSAVNQRWTHLVRTVVNHIERSRQP